jgi:hypothetical protein
MTHSNPAPNDVRQAEQARLLKLKHNLHPSVWTPLWLDYLAENYDLETA